MREREKWEAKPWMICLSVSRSLSLFVISAFSPTWSIIYLEICFDFTLIHECNAISSEQKNDILWSSDLMMSNQSDVQWRSTRKDKIRFNDVDHLLSNYSFRVDLLFLLFSPRCKNQGADLINSNNIVVV